ncbi:hypothetical protein ACVWXP_003782 [Bradyrhizobium sp. USDA 4463]
MAVVFSEFGLHEVLRRLVRRLRGDRQLALWLNQKEVTDAAFDRRYGTDTGGVQNLSEVTGIVGGNSKYGLSHIATDPEQFTAAIDSLGLPLAEYTFVDLGCGKGRALMLAGEQPFKRIIGVEFAPAFADAARRNLAAAARNGLRGDIEVVTGDATQFDYPPGPLLIYLFNPFESSIIRQVAQRLRDTWVKDRLPIVIVYANPIHSATLGETGWSIFNRGGGWTAYAPGQTQYQFDGGCRSDS